VSFRSFAPVPALALALAACGPAKGGPDGGAPGPDGGSSSCAGRLSGAATGIFSCGDPDVIWRSASDDTSLDTGSKASAKPHNVESVGVSVTVPKPVSARSYIYDDLESAIVTVFLTDGTVYKATKTTAVQTGDVSMTVNEVTEVGSGGGNTRYLAHGILDATVPFDTGVGSGDVTIHMVF
jgi:hypothetical protein